MGKQINATTAVVIIAIVVIIAGVVGWKIVSKKDTGTSVDEATIDQPMMMNPGTVEGKQATPTTPGGDAGGG